MTTAMELRQNIGNIVTIESGKAMTTSLKVAEVFGKMHKNVIQSIESLQVPDNWHELNFQPSSIEQKMPNGGTKQIPMYTITRDGFTILAMGFTGRKAMEFKIAYIEAFNAMEEKLKRIAASASSSLPSQEILMATLQVEMEKRIRYELECKQYRANLERIAKASNLTFGEISRDTGLPKDIVIAPHCKSSTRPHVPQQRRYIQLILPLQDIVDECRRQIATGAF